MYMRVHNKVGPTFLYFGMGINATEKLFFEKVRYLEGTTISTMMFPLR